MIDQLNFSISHLLIQIEQAIAALSDRQFCSPEPLLGSSTTGQHIRHILEFYIELAKGYQSGTIDYDGRQRDHMLESCRASAINKLAEIRAEINREDKILTICTGLHAEGEGKFLLPTSYYRELMYNLEHTVHHMALIRVGICLSSKIVLPADFGVAASTIRYKQLCAQ